jgi:hypothetical protein
VIAAAATVFFTDADANAFPETKVDGLRTALGVTSVRELHSKAHVSQVLLVVYLLVMCTGGIFFLQLWAGAGAVGR